MGSEDVLLVAGEPPSIDRELLDDLSDDPIDDFDRTLLRGDGDADEPGGEGEGLQDRLRRELGAAAVSEDENPLLGVARLMQQAERRIADNKAGKDTRVLQEQVVAKLDQLIDEARRRCSQGGKTSSQPGSRRPTGEPQTPSSPGEQANDNPAANSTVRPPGESEDVRVSDLKMIKDVMHELWGELPEHQRQRMLQAPPEVFLPQYETLIEEYYRRLAEEKGWRER